MSKLLILLALVICLEGALIATPSDTTIRFSVLRIPPVPTAQVGIYLSVLQDD